jgi:hypothetical protein
MARWCPTCGAEYRDGFTRCADCDIDLVDHEPVAPEPPAPHKGHDGPFSPDDDTVELLRTNRLEADVIAARLRSEGIPAVVFDNTAYGSGPLLANASGVRVMVRRSDLEVASALAADTA